MAMNCPICEESFKDGRGLHGHLRFKEDLSGEELEETFQQAKEESAGEEGKDPVLQQIKRVALHHGITPLKVVRNVRSTMMDASPWGDLELESKTFSTSQEQKVAKEVLGKLEDRLEQQKEEAEEEMNTVLRKRIKRRA